MITHLKYVSLAVILAPLIGSAIAGLFGKVIGRRASHRATIILMTLACVCSIVLFKWVIYDGVTFNGTLYTWLASGSFSFNIGFMIDHLSVVMMLIVTFVSLVVHIYSIGYMSEDPGYQRFFSYVSIFTFFMLMLVTANNFLQLFFGWEGVGLVSYLLISFWFKKEGATEGGLKGIPR